MARAYHIRQSGNELFISTDNNERRKLKAKGWRKIDSKDAYALVAPLAGSTMNAGYWWRNKNGRWVHAADARGVFSVDVMANVAEEEREADYRLTILCGGAIEQEVDSDDLEELIKAANAWRAQEEREIRLDASIERAKVAIYDTFACANLIFTPEL